MKTDLRDFSRNSDAGDFDTENIPDVVVENIPDTENIHTGGDA